jgi:hypothetical protein
MGHSKPLLGGVVAVAAMALSAAPASAVDAGQLVSGTAVGTIALTIGTPGAFTGFSPGTTSGAAGTLVATSTNPSWTLSAKDAAVTTPGKMDAAGGATCDGGVSSLSDSLKVTVTGAGTSAGQISISDTAQTVASSPAAGLPIAAAVLSTGYQQTIGSTEALEAGCVYSLTTTYTLQ